MKFFLPRSSSSSRATALMSNHGNAGLGGELTTAEWRENINGMIARVPSPKVETSLRNDADLISRLTILFQLEFINVVEHPLFIVVLVSRTHLKSPDSYLLTPPC